uniref:Metallothionein n=1 Tax=uncultured eukaryote TaxID=100272 RepID=K7ZV61_9EUKA|nr:Metallothionein [uncultured eukaryote]
MSTNIQSIPVNQACGNSACTCGASCTCKPGECKCKS